MTYNYVETMDVFKIDLRFGFISLVVGYCYYYLKLYYFEDLFVNEECGRTIAYNSNDNYQDSWDGVLNF